MRLGAVYATSIDLSRYTSWMVLSSLMPSAIGRWKAFRPEIRPMPPGRLLIDVDGDVADLLAGIPNDQLCAIRLTGR